MSAPRSPETGEDIVEDAVWIERIIIHLRFVSILHDGPHEYFDLSAIGEGAGMSNGTQSHLGISQRLHSSGCNEADETKPTDQAILWTVSESLGRNASELIGGLDKISFAARAFFGRAKATWYGTD